MKKTGIFVLTTVLIYSGTLFAETDIKKKQSNIINNVLNKADRANYDKSVEIINYIDETYGTLYEKLSNNGKFTIYFGPAHGKDSSGIWRGISTDRIGVTGLPEEYYSIQYSRKLYNLLKGNKFIEVSAAPYYMDVLEGRSDSYHYMKFVDVADNAYNAGAFLVVEMHMNNVSVFEKADGLVNMPGIHMVRDSSGRKMLKNIVGTYSGFLTLYNKFDTSGFSRQYAINIKNSLEAKGYNANGWEYGAVGDDRFSYYLLFPVSVIYECGFISNPAEEKKLKDPYYMDGMISSHYEMLLKTIYDLYGIDISGNNIKGNPKDVTARIELLKLARLTIHFIDNADISGANASVQAMKKYYRHVSSGDCINYYSSIISKINRAERYYKRGINFKKKKKFRKARECFVNARGSLNRNIMYSTLKEKYNSALYGNRSNRNTSSQNKRTAPSIKQKNETARAVIQSSISRPFIISLSSNETIEHALSESLAAGDNEITRISEAMKDYHSVSWKKVKKYSKKRKKKIWISKKIVKKYEFTPGIHIVTIDKNLNLTKAVRVSSVYLDPHKYQNQQYLKNSYFAETIQEKNI